MSNIRHLPFALTFANLFFAFSIPNLFFAFPISNILFASFICVFFLFFYYFLWSALQ